MKTKIYDLQLNQSVDEGDFKITRVPGGWIYLQIKDTMTSTVFVPFHKEFENSKAGFDIR